MNGLSLFYSFFTIKFPNFTLENHPAKIYNLIQVRACPGLKYEETDTRVSERRKIMDKIKMAVVGYGGMGGWHVRQVLDMDKFELKGIWDIDPERREIAKENGLGVYSSFEAVLEDKEVELVLIATWNDVHKPLAIAAMRAGKNVISEKPVTLSSEDLNEMIAVAEETGKLFTVHQNRRWDSDFLTMKNIYDKNTLGRIFRIESRVQGSRGIPGDWRKEKQHGGGMVYDWGVHLLDQALTFCDSDPLVSVYAQLTNITNVECDDGFYAELRFKSGLSYLVEVTTNNFISLPRWYILGENGSSSFDWDLNGQTVLVRDWEKIDAVPVKVGTGITKTMAPRTDETISEIPIEEMHGEWVEYYDNIYDVIRNGAEQTVCHRQMRRCLALIEAIFESGAKNEVVKFNDLYYNK